MGNCINTMTILLRLLYQKTLCEIVDSDFLGIVKFIVANCIGTMRHSG